MPHDNGPAGGARITTTAGGPGSPGPGPGSHSDDASALFGLYVAQFSNYNKTYGSLAGVIIFLLWLWITNLALLFGAELNAETERGRQLQAGIPAEDELQVPPRAPGSSTKPPPPTTATFSRDGHYAAAAATAPPRHASTTPPNDRAGTADRLQPRCACPASAGRRDTFSGRAERPRHGHPALTARLVSLVGHRSEQRPWVPAAVAGHRKENSAMHIADRPSTSTGCGPAPGMPARSGPLPVSEVNGHRPRGLDDFLGVTSFTVISGELSYRVFGTGEPGTGPVRFRQQDLGRHGRAIRTWTITATSTGIIAEPEPAAGNRNPGPGDRPQRDGRP